MGKLNIDLVLNPFVRWLEKILAAAVLGSVILAAIHGAIHLAGLDVSANETFYARICRMLLLVIGLERVRMLITRRLDGRKYLMSRSCYLPRELENDIGAMPGGSEDAGGAGEAAR